MIVKVFTATRPDERERLGERVTEYIRARPELEVIKKAVTLSSDERFHCLTIVLMLAERRASPKRRRSRNGT